MFTEIIRWPMRLLVDASLLAMFIAPSAITLLLFAVLAMKVTKRVATLPAKVFGGRLYGVLLGSPTDSVGQLRARVRHWALVALLNQLPAIVVGIPMLKVFDLMLAASGAVQLRAMASGYRWQEQALARLPLSRYHDFVAISGYFPWGQGLAVLILVMVIYNNASRGFALVRGCRRVSDSLVRIVPGLVTPTPSLPEAAIALQEMGWDYKAIRAALWFLSLMNARIAFKNTAYETLTPSDFGFHQVFRSTAIVTPLTYLNPVAGAFYLVTKIDGQKKLQDTIGQARRFYEDLPHAFRTKTRLDL